MRFENTPGLFGIGVGISTCGSFLCDICGTAYNEDDDGSDEYEGDGIATTQFAGLNVCGNCFETIENGVLRRMPDIISWYKRLLDVRKSRLKEDESLLKSLLKESEVNNG
jgi:hypothetical protein